MDNSIIVTQKVYFNRCHYRWLPFEARFMDAYCMARMFRIYFDSVVLPAVPETHPEHNSILVVGDLHAETYRKFLAKNKTI